MINNRYILFLLSHPRSRSFHREASTIQPSAFLKFDVAKLGVGNKGKQENGIYNRFSQITQKQRITKTISLQEEGGK